MAVKLEKFSRTGSGNFEAWWHQLEYCFIKEAVAELEQTTDVIFHLTGKALDWYSDLQRDSTIPATMKELNKVVAKKLGKTTSEMFAM